MHQTSFVLGLALCALLLAAGPAPADDASTLTVEGKVYRLEGIDAPDLDQTCLNESGEPFACGRKAWDALTTYIAGRTVFCTELGADPASAKRQLGQCFVDGVDLNHWLVENGWAVGFEPAAKGRFKTDEDDARQARAGLWNGCFVAPRDFRTWKKSAAVLLGPACTGEARDALFPDEAPQPAGFTVKAHYAMRAFPYAGIYHLQGCGSYRRTKAKRWFRSEEDAIAAGFRKTYTCDWW